MGSGSDRTLIGVIEQFSFGMYFVKGVNDYSYENKIDRTFGN